MKYNYIAGKYKISRIGIGGHYSKMEEGDFEERYAEVGADEIGARTKLMERAFENGVTYLDTTWRNEVDMLSRSIEPLHIRDDVFINGMVLGVFRGAAATNLDPRDYMNKWLDERLKSLPQNRFDSLMINAIDEDYDEGKCEKVIRLLEKRKKDGDFKVIGFSCHNHALARKVADTFPEFELIMTAYNYKNRSFEVNFDDYKGNASFVAMKPLIWYEYGVPFCRINNLSNAEQVLGAAPVEDIAAKAVQWNLKNKLITTTVCAVNNEEELTQLLAAGDNDIAEKDEAALEVYRLAIEKDDHIPFLISAILCPENNRRSLSFGLNNLAHALKAPCPYIPLNTKDSDRLLKELKENLLAELQRQGYGGYIG